MSQKQFEWDAFFSKCSFSEINRLSPEFSSRRCPSIYSPDGKLFYISSQDNDVETDNEKQLRAMLIDVRASYISASHPDKGNRNKAYIARIDFLEICRLLASLTDDPTEFSDPDNLLEVI